jgi:hypothetical protein
MKCTVSRQVSNRVAPPRLRPSLSRFAAITIGTLVLCRSSFSARAIEVPYGSFSGAVINFDSLSGTNQIGTGEVLSNQFAAQGVTFDVPNFSAYARIDDFGLSLNSDPNLIWVNNGGGSGGSDALGLNINFNSPQAFVGVYFAGSENATFGLTAYSGGTLLETVAISGSLAFEKGFLALTNSSITRVVAFSANTSGQNWNFFLDDLKFSPVPEPLSSSVALAAMLAFKAVRGERQRSLHTAGK